MAVENKPLMPKATAVWLVDNTGLSFEQIADFCGLHPLEVKGIADEDVAKGIKGQDPVATGQLTREQIAEAEKDPKKRLKMAAPKHKMPNVRQKRGTWSSSSIATCAISCSVTNVRRPRSCSGFAAPPRPRVTRRWRPG